MSFKNLMFYAVEKGHRTVSVDNVLCKIIEDDYLMLDSDVFYQILMHSSIPEDEEKELKLMKWSLDRVDGVETQLRQSKLRGCLARHC